MPKISICDPLELRNAKRAQFQGGYSTVVLNGKKLHVQILSITPGHNLDAWTVNFVEKAVTVVKKQPRWRYQCRY